MHYALPMPANNWTSGAASRHTTTQISHTVFTPQPVLLISHPTEGRRLSWPEHAVGWQLAQGRLQMTCGEIQTTKLSPSLSPGLSDEGSSLSPGLSDEGSSLCPGLSDEGSRLSPGLSDEGSSPSPGLSDEGSSPSPGLSDEGSNPIQIRT